jgi:site-specific recombinase XerD
MGITLSQAIDGFVLECGSRRLSENTTASYVSVLGKLQRSLPDNPVLASITPEVLKRFLVETRGPGGAKLSNKTILNYHICLSALWTWALAEGHVARHVVHDVPKPKAEKPAISPMSEDDVRRLLGSLERSRRYKRPGKQICDNRRLTAARDRAIILMLLDAGLRASELCDMKVKDVDVRNQRVYVWGKGSRERVMPLSAATTKAIWRYLQTERGQARIADPLFVQRDDASQKMNRTALRQLLVRIGERAGVRDCHPHRFRHTFAITCLRNGMNAYALQMALGHSTMEMVRVYLEIAQADLDAAHRQASPVANWGL